MSGYGVNCGGDSSRCPGFSGLTNFASGVATLLPATLPLIATGLAGLGWRARRRRKQTAALSSAALSKKKAPANVPGFLVG